MHKNVLIVTDFVREESFPDKPWRSKPWLSNLGLSCEKLFFLSKNDKILSSTTPIATDIIIAVFYKNIRRL